MLLNILCMLQMLLLETSSTISEMLGVLKQLHLTLISKLPHRTNTFRPPSMVRCEYANREI